MRDVLYLVLILILSKVASSHNEAHTFLYQICLKLPIEILKMLEITKWCLDSILFLFLFYLEPVDNHYAIPLML